MTENRPENQPAFPIFNSEGIPTWTKSDCLDDGLTGVSKRLYAACAIIQGLLANSNYKDTDAHSNKKSLVKLSYALADELLKQEAE